MVYGVGGSSGVSHDFGHCEDNTYCVLPYSVFRIPYSVFHIALKVTFNVTLKGDISIDLAERMIMPAHLVKGYY